MKPAPGELNAKKMTSAPSGRHKSMTGVKRPPGLEVPSSRAPHSTAPMEAKSGELRRFHRAFVFLQWRHILETTVGQLVGVVEELNAIKASVVASTVD